MKTTLKLEPSIRLKDSGAEKYFCFQPATFDALNYLYTRKVDKACVLDLTDLPPYEHRAFVEAASVYKRGISVQGFFKEEPTFQDNAEVNFFLDVSTLVKFVQSLSFDLIICDSNVFRHWSSFFANMKPIFFDSDEKNKSLNSVVNFFRDNEISLNKGLRVLVIGGGVLSDVFGFLGSRWDWELTIVPTTLLAQVDAAHGGKNSLNLEGVGKNIIGSLYAARRVLCCTEFLESISDIDWKSGCSEALKHAILMKNQNFMEEILNLMKQKNILAMNRILPALIDFKKRIVAKDSLDIGLRNVLNYGHSIGHALEGLSIYEEETKVLPHGLAVLVGMLVESKIAKKMGQSIDASFCEYVETSIRNSDFFGHPYSRDLLHNLHNSEIARSVFYKMIAEDKKNRFNPSENFEIYFSRFWDIESSYQAFTWRISMDELKIEFGQILDELCQ